MPTRTESRFIEISGNIIFGGSRVEEGELSWHRQATGGGRARQVDVGWQERVAVKGR